MGKMSFYIFYLKLGELFTSSFFSLPLQDLQGFFVFVRRSFLAFFRSVILLTIDTLFWSNADGGIRSVDLCCLKRLLFQLRHNLEILFTHFTFQTCPSGWTRPWRGSETSPAMPCPTRTFSASSTGSASSCSTGSDPSSCSTGRPPPWRRRPFVGGACDRARLENSPGSFGCSLTVPVMRLQCCTPALLCSTQA